MTGSFYVRVFQNRGIQTGYDFAGLGFFHIQKTQGEPSGIQSIPVFFGKDRNQEGERFFYEPKVREITGTAASVRLDSLLSLAFGASRSSLTGLIEGGKVFVNGRLVTSNGYQPKEGDLVSVRGMGRFRLQGIGGQSKKGRSYVTLLKYI